MMMGVVILCCFGGFGGFGCYLYGYCLDVVVCYVFDCEGVVVDL